MGVIHDFKTAQATQPDQPDQPDQPVQAAQPAQVRSPTGPTDPTGPTSPTGPNLRLCFIKKDSAHDFIKKTLLIAEPPALMTSFVQSSTQKKYNISRAEAV